MEKRLMRLVWNNNGWETPIKRKYNPSFWKDGKNNASFEKSFGFGHEDWLLNSRNYIDGWQYGYIRGVERLSSDLTYIDELYLYTIETEAKSRLLVFKISNVEIIEGYKTVQEFIEPEFKKFREQLIEELKAAEVDHTALDKFTFLPNVRFRLDDVRNYGYSNEIDELRKPQFNRFTPYIVDESLEKILLKNILSPVNFIFKEGKAKSTIAHNRIMKSGESFNKRIHSDITEDLYKFLTDIKNHDKNSISIENSRIGGLIVDGVIQNLNTYSFFEIKTASTATANIREAIGQLLEYSLLDENVQIKKLIIVGPAIMKKEEQKYFERIRNTIKAGLEYWAYRMNEKNLEDKFKVY